MTLIGSLGGETVRSQTRKIRKVRLLNSGWRRRIHMIGFCIQKQEIFIRMRVAGLKDNEENIAAEAKIPRCYFIRLLIVR